MDKNGRKHDDKSNNKHSENENNINNCKKIYLLNGKEMSVEQIDPETSNNYKQDDEDKITYDWTTSELSPFYGRNFSVKIILAGDSDVGK